MATAVFTLIGTALGVLGTVAAQLVRARTDDSRTRREQVRSACADFASSLARVRELGIQLFEPRFDSPQDWESIREAHLEARAHYERLRLTSSSRAVQEAGRRATRYAFGVMLQSAGKAPREDERERGALTLLNDSLIDLYAAVRRELGLPHPDDVYREPDEWLVPYEILERAKAAKPTDPGQSTTA
jgi:hypothetical protein